MHEHRAQKQVGTRGAVLSVRHLNLSVRYLKDLYAEHEDFTGAKLNGAYLPGAQLLGADFTGVDFTGANMMGANMIACTMTNACWMHVFAIDLQGRMTWRAACRGLIIARPLGFGSVSS